MGPLLSIVIPTRNRQVYAASAVRAILAWPSSDLELVVRDNSDEATLASMLAEYRGDPRLRFFEEPGLVSSQENFARALGQATGDFVCAIGDDDILNPEIMTAVRFAAERGVDALVTDRHRALYQWPDFRAADTGAAEAATLHIFEFSGAVEYVDPEEELRKCTITAGTSLQRLPKVYLGVIRRECLREVQNSTSEGDIGTCPDMYFAVAAASATKSAMVIDYPLIVPGASAPSTAGANRMKQHEGKLESAPHFRGRPNYDWPVLIPAFYSVDTFYAESALAGLRATNRTDLIQGFNFPFLYVLAAVRHSSYLGRTLSSLGHFRRQSGVSTWKLPIRIFRSLVTVAALLLNKRLAARSFRPGMTLLATTIGGLKDSAVASDALTCYLRDRGFSLERMLAPND